MRAELALALVEDLRAEDVRRQQVDRELHAVELQVDGSGEAVDEKRLGQARHALQQQMSAGEQRDQQPLDDCVLSDDNLRDAFANSIDETGGGGGHKARVDRTFETAETSGARQPLPSLAFDCNTSLSRLNCARER